MALIEAMAAGAPVVSTEVGGVADVVQHGVTGLLAPMDDDAGLAQHVAATNGAGRLVADIVGLYEELLTEKRLSPKLQILHHRQM